MLIDTLLSGDSWASSINFIKPTFLLPDPRAKTRFEFRLARFVSSRTLVVDTACIPDAALFVFHTVSVL